MDKTRKASAEIYEIPVYPSTEEVFYVRERPIEAISRRLEELGLTVTQLAFDLEEDATHVRLVLDEEIRGSEELMGKMLFYTGLEAVAVKRTYLTGFGGHWPYRERCVYCGSNTYDLAAYGPEVCSASRLSKSGEES